MNPDRLTLMGVLLVALSACASKPIETDAELGDLTPSTVRSSAQSSDAAESGDTMQVLMWGGVILDVENLSDGSQIEVLAYPLDRRQRPRTSARADARFLVQTSDYLEPVDFAKGRLVTVLGRLQGLTEGQVGESRYDYPTLVSEQIHLWSETQERSSPNFSFGIGVNL